MEPVVLAATIISGVLGPVGIFIGMMTWLNGKRSRELMLETRNLVLETRNLISEESKLTRELISTESSGIRSILQRMDAKLDAIYSQATQAGSS